MDSWLTLKGWRCFTSALPWSRCWRRGGQASSEQPVLALFTAKGILTREPAVSYLKPLRGSSISLHLVCQLSLRYLFFHPLPQKVTSPQQSEECLFGQDLGLILSAWKLMVVELPWYRDGHGSVLYLGILEGLEPLLLWQWNQLHQGSICISVRHQIRAVGVFDCRG